MAVNSWGTLAGNVPLGFSGITEINLLGGSEHVSSLNYAQHALPWTGP